MTTPRYSKRHYEDVAKVIRDQRSWKTPTGNAEVCKEIAARFADLFAADNPRFDRQKFLVALRSSH